MALTVAQRAHLLEGLGLFSSASPDGLAAIAEGAVEVEFSEGQRIARQGEIEAGFFVVVAGSVRIVRDGEDVARLGPGEFFGELSLLDHAPRVASAVAAEPTTCLALPSWEFERLLETEPGVATAILQAVAHRMRTLTSDRRH
jgi:CRP/FNR family transcriptional regulator, cyclic AMP receptor protein